MIVSVAIITYNHEKYISKALDTVLAQQTDFDYEIVIGEDCSSDNTRSILLDYKDRYPDKIKLICNERNLGAHRNAEQTLRACSSTYVAVLDGDDYWASPDKLQKQVHFLDTHPEFVLCFHDALICYEDGSREPTRYRPYQKAFISVEDLLLDNVIPTSSVMFRRGTVAKVPEWVSALKMGDWPIYILYALHGPIGYIDETMSVYVVHREGVWSMKTWQDHTVAMIELFEALDRHLEPQYTRSTTRILRRRYSNASVGYEQAGDLACARSCAVKAFVKHVVIASEQLFFWKRREPSPMPAEITSVRGAMLIKNLVRLYVRPVLQTYFPFSLYKRLGAIARKLAPEF